MRTPLISSDCRFPRYSACCAAYRVIPLAAAVRDAVEGSSLVVGDEEASVGHHLDVNGAAPNIPAIEPALGENLLLDCLAAFDDHARYAVPDPLAAVPGAVLGDEDRVLILGWKLAAGIEPHSERRHMRPQLSHRRHEVATRSLPAELGVGDVALMAIRIAEMLTRLRRVI